MQATRNGALDNSRMQLNACSTHKPIASHEAWICRRTVCRLNTRCYATLSLVCLFSSRCAIELLASGGTKFLPGAGFVCWLLVLFNATMIVLSVLSALTEKPRTMTLRYPDPNHDLTELY